MSIKDAEKAEAEEKSFYNKTPQGIVSKIFKVQCVCSYIQGNKLQQQSVLIN